MKRGESESYKKYIYQEELKANIGKEKYEKIRKMKTKIKCKKTSVGEFIKKITE